MSWLQIIGLVEAIVILVLTEPVLNRMSPCAPMIMLHADNKRILAELFSDEVLRSIKLLAS